MLFKLVWENVRHRPVRTLLSVLLIAIPVTLILTLVGVTHGFLENSLQRSQGVGADILFRPPGSSVLGSFSGAPLPEKFVEALEMQPHVTAAAGVFNQLIGGTLESIAGINEANFDKLSGPFVFIHGHGLTDPDDILVDQYYAEQHNIHAGQSINLLNHEWRVAGIVQPGKLSHLFVEMPVLQKMFGAPNKVSQIYIKLDNPANTDMVIAALKTKYPGYPVYSMKELESYYNVNSIPLLKGFTDTVLGIGVVIGFLVVSMSMYMAVLQRTREIGILKSLGASSDFVMRLILAEAFVLAAGGSILGIGFSFGTRAVINTFLRATLPSAIVPLWWPIAALIAVIGALLGALYPGMLAVHQDPIEALAYE